MLLTNWLAKKDGYGGLALPNEFADGNVRLYGNLYGHPDFQDGEYVQTAAIVDYDGVKVHTVSGCEFILVNESQQYLNFLKASERGAMVVKNWSIENGKLVGVTLNGETLKGRVINQSFKYNICTLSDGKRLYVDWLAKDPNFSLKPGPDDLLLFCIEKCMPDIFCKHYALFREKGCC